MKKPYKSQFWSQRICITSALVEIEIAVQKDGDGSSYDAVIKKAKSFHKRSRREGLEEAEEEEDGSAVNPTQKCNF
ncbi:hypothetical protein TcWFU_006107 [Taenia crassiceps]|uniref:Uncharacterized protein n=1 Tax=Taenia crassiceps TaxID=6207 RepID=A0ABR4Q4Y5_9CEST